MIEYYADYKNSIEDIYHNISNHGFEEYINKFIDISNVCTTQFRAIKKGFEAVKNEKSRLVEDDSLVLLAINTKKQQSSIILFIKYSPIKNYDYLIEIIKCNHKKS